MTASLASARPATRILVAGYGVMTAGIIPHLVNLPHTRVTIASKHLAAAPLPGTTLMRPHDVARAEPDVIIGCFADDPDSQAFWTSAHTTDSLASHDPVCIELSTISPGWAEDWHNLISGHGGIPVECPVTGSRPGATTGTLSAFLYTPVQDDRTETVLAAFTAHRYAFTRPGNPARFKLIYNAWGASILHSLGVFARQLPAHLGEDYPIAARAVTTDGWMSTIAASKLPRMERQDYADPDFAARHMLKDLEHARDLLGALPLIDLTANAFAQAVADHGPYADFTAVADQGSAS
ncbi:NAD(P)-binding domain-containing protein [Streptomyces goshikiensis]|uniref:NAD(P)-binding domain-containing protein n=2 Tax=Streptomyces goshikiensis TaxID=1942 RepID=UPI00364AE5DA